MDYANIQTTKYLGLRKYLTLTYKPGDVGTIAAPPHQKTGLSGKIFLIILEMKGKILTFEMTILILLHDYHQTNL